MAVASIFIFKLMPLNFILLVQNCALIISPLYIVTCSTLPYPSQRRTKFKMPQTKPVICLPKPGFLEVSQVTLPYWKVTVHLAV